MLECVYRLPAIMFHGARLLFRQDRNQLAESGVSNSRSPFSLAFLIHDLSLSGSLQFSVSPRIFATLLMLPP
jgi:hypothetical protein